MTIDKALSMNAELRKLYESDEQVHVLIDMSKRLEGLPRHTSMHAAGVVISNEPLWKKTPIYKPSGEETFVTQYSLNFLEDIDLIKFDFLGLKTLDVIDNAIKLIKKRYDVEVNWHTIDENDPKVYEIIQSGSTIYCCLHHFK
jgi:DNA polymerase-3 subunit alpha